MEIPSNIIDNTKTQHDAEKVADAYFKFPLAGSYGFWSGEKEAQKVVDKFYPGYNVSVEPRQQVFTDEKNKSSVINFNGTETPKDAWKGWGDSASPAQSSVASVASGLLDSAAASLGLSPYYDSFKVGGSYILNSVTSDVPDLEQRIERGNALVSSVREKYPDHHILLTGYSMGGLVAERVATKNRLDALLFNSAIGKHTIDQDADKRIMKFRIANDAVSKRFDNSPQFTFDKKTENPGGLFSAWEKLVTDTDRIGQPTDPIQSHWLENFSLSRKRLHDQLMSETPTVATTKSPMHTQPLITPKHDFFSVGLHCKPCPKGKLFCRCDID